MAHDDADLLRQAQLAHRHAKDAYDEADRKAAPVLAAAQQLWDAQWEADFGPDSGPNDGGTGGSDPGGGPGSGAPGVSQTTIAAKVTLGFVALGVAIGGIVLLLHSRAGVDSHVRVPLSGSGVASPQTEGGAAENASPHPCSLLSNTIAIKGCFIDEGDRLRNSNYGGSVRAYEQAIAVPKYDGTGLGLTVRADDGTPIPEKLQSDWLTLDALQKLASLYSEHEVYDKALTLHLQAGEIQTRFLLTGRTPPLRPVDAIDCYARFALIHKVRGAKESLDTSDGCVAFSPAPGGWSPKHCERARIHEELGDDTAALAWYSACVGQDYATSAETRTQEEAKWRASRWWHLAPRAATVASAKASIAAILGRLRAEGRALLSDGFALWSSKSNSGVWHLYILPLVWDWQYPGCLTTSGKPMEAAAKAWDIKNYSIDEPIPHGVLSYSMRVAGLYIPVSAKARQRVKSTVKFDQPITNEPRCMVRELNSPFCLSPDGVLESEEKCR